MKIEVTKLPKSTFKLRISVPVAEVKKTYEEVLDEHVKQTELPGFRKGNAPKELVLEKTDISKLYGEVINELLQKFYPQAVKEKNISPIANPKVEIKGFDMEKDFDFEATVATRPETKVKDFRTSLKKTYEEKAKKLSEENAEKIKKGEKVESTHYHISPNEIIEGMISNAEVEVPDLLVDEETDRMMSRLVNEVRTIGLTMEQYLKAQNKTSEQLKEEYAQAALRNLKAEFVMGEIVKNENIEVADSEIEEAVKVSGDPDYAKRLQNPVEKWYVKSILQKNKLINNLIEEIQGKHDHE